MTLNFETTIEQDVEPDDEIGEMLVEAAEAGAITAEPSVEEVFDSATSVGSSDFVPTPGPKDAEVVEFLTGDDPVSAGLLEDAFTTAAQPWAQGTSLQELSDAYTTASYWYAVSKDRKRRNKAAGEWGDDDVLRAQLSEDYMEALVKALDKAMMVAMATAKYGGA